MLLNLNVEEVQRIFGECPTLDEDEVTCAFALKSTVNQLDVTSAYFGLRVSDVIVENVVEDSQLLASKVELLGNLLRKQKSDRTAAPLFGRSLPGAFPAGLLN